MTVWRDVGGLILLAAFLAALNLGAVRLRRWLAPDLPREAAACAQVIVVVALVVIVLEALGVVGMLHVVPVTIVGIAVGAALAISLRNRGRAPIQAPADPQLTALERTVLGLVGVAVAAPWLGWTVYAYQHGMETVDTLWYHLPQAARFAQVGNVRALQFFDGGPVTAFYPANSELLHALGIIMLRSDLLSPLITLMWGGLAMFAAWAVGRPYGRAVHAVVAMAILLGTPAYVKTQPGGAYNDIVCIALLAAAAAVLVQGGVERGPIAVAAIALGITVGTKFTMIVPGLALGAGLISVRSSASRRHRAGAWLAGLAGLGAFWYVRNLANTGTPAPSLPLHLSSLLPTPSGAPPAVPVIDNVGSGRAWRVYLLPGLRDAFGPVWWAILATAAGGAVSAAVGRRRAIVAILGWVAIVSAGGYLITPQFLGLASFVYNTRYAAPALVLGLLAAALAIPDASRRSRDVALVVGVAVFAGTEIDGAVWRTGIGHSQFAPALGGSAAVAGAGLAILLTSGGVVMAARGTHRWVRRPAVFAVAVVVVIAAVGLLGHVYQQRRYLDTAPMPRIFAWARSIHHARIGVIGSVAQYPLLGLDDSNFVQFLGRPAPHGGYDPFTDAAQWQRALRTGRYGWVVIAPSAYPFSTQTAPQLAWTQAIPGARETIVDRLPGAPAYDTATLFRLGPAGRR